MTTFPFFSPPLQGCTHPLQPARMLPFLLLLPLPCSCLVSPCFNLVSSHLPSQRSTRLMASAFFSLGVLGKSHTQMSLASTGAAPHPACSGAAGKGLRQAGRMMEHQKRCCKAGLPHLSRCTFAVWMLAPKFRGRAVPAAVLAARAEQSIRGFPCLLRGKPFQLPGEPGGQGPATPAEAPASRGRLLASRGIFSSGLTGAPYVCVLLFPFAFYVLSRCRKESRSLPAMARMWFCCSTCHSPLRGCFPELCL